MKKPSNYDEFEATESISFDGLKDGIYPIKIVSVEDIIGKEYLKIKIDIADGEYKGVFAKLANNNLENWSSQATIYKSYKETATKFFKAFITAIEKSNRGYIWNWDEKTLVGKYAYAVYQEEEYLYSPTPDELEKRTAVKCQEIRSIEAFKNGDIKEPKGIKLLNKKDQTKWENWEDKPVGNSVSNDPFAAIKNQDISESDLPF